MYRFLIREGIDRYDPERFLDYKLSCVLAMLEDLPKYDSSKGADFLTFAHYNIGNALLECRMREEAGSFENVDEYKAVRGIAWLYNNSEKTEKEVVAEYAVKHNCSEKNAAEHLKVARMNRSRVPFCSTAQDEDAEETGEDVTQDDSWNYADILWDGIRAVELRRVSQTKAGKKISAAVYEYLVDCDGEWGKIQFDFSAGTAKIEALADWDTTKSHVFANRAISHLLSLPMDALPKKLLLAFE